MTIPRVNERGLPMFQGAPPPRPRKTRGPRLGALAFLASAAAIPAQAQTATELPAISVGGAPAAAGSLTVPSVEAQRRALEQIAGSVAFVDSRSFENRYTNNIPDVLKDTPGVFAQTRYGQEVRLSIRGSGIARSFHTRGIEILQDGIPFNLADGSGDYYQIDPLALRSVEVYKGGNGLIFGSSTLGGAVNFVSPTAYTAIGSNILRVEGGSFGAIRTNVQGSRIDGPVDALINATYSHQDGFRAHQNQDYVQINGNVGFQIAPGIETRTYLGVYPTRQKLPGTLDLPTALAFPRSATAAVLSGNQSREVTTERVANRTSFTLDIGQLDIDSWLIQKRLYHPIFQVIDQSGKTYGVSPHWAGSFDLGDGVRNDLVVGARAFGGDNSAQQYVNVAGNRGALTASARQNAQNYEAYAENRLWLWPDLAVVGGSKLFRDERDFRNRFTLPNRSADQTYQGINPKIGLLYQPMDDVQVFADITRSRDVPDFSDLAQSNTSGLTFVPLAAQRAWTAEVGTRGRVEGLRWDLTFYRSELRGELLNFTTNAALGIPSATFNANRTLHQGVEVGLAYDLLRDISGPGAGDTLTVAPVYTYSDFRFVRDRVYGNDQIAAVPTHVLRTTLTYRRPDGFFIGPVLDWVPEGAYADHANTLRAPGYALIGVTAGATLGSGLSVYVDARNLADRRYISDIGAITDARKVSSAVFYPGEGRSVFAGLRYVY